MYPEHVRLIAPRQQLPLDVLGSLYACDVLVVTPLFIALTTRNTDNDTHLSCLKAARLNNLINISTNTTTYTTIHNSTGPQQHCLRPTRASGPEAQVLKTLHGCTEDQQYGMQPRHNLCWATSSFLVERSTSKVTALSCTD